MERAARISPSRGAAYPATDMTLAYAGRLAAAGVPVRYLGGAGLTQGFLYYPRVSAACAAARDAFALAVTQALKGKQHVG